MANNKKYTQERHGYFMKKCILLFTDSTKEFKNLNSVTTAALLVALHTVLAVFVSIQVTTSLRISISFITNVVTGCLFGPVIGFVCGGIGDIVQFIIKPVGGYFPGWTLNAAVAGLIYGLFFYKKFPNKTNIKKEPSGKIFNIFKFLLPSDGRYFIRVAVCLTIDTILVNVLMGTYWTSIMTGKGFWFYFTTRMTKNLIQLPINIILSYYILSFVRGLHFHVLKNNIKNKEPHKECAKMRKI